ncbi:MAG: hypothetical protein V7629_13320 [Motiliproteus sp.]
MFRPDRLILRRSYPLAGLVVGVHLVVIAATLSNALPLALKLLLLIVVVWQAVYLLRRYVLLSHASSVREIRWTELAWFVRLADGSEFEVRPAAGCRLYGWITLLRFEVLYPAPDRRLVLSAWLLGGLRSEQAIRRLRVQLIQTYSNQN